VTHNDFQFQGAMKVVGVLMAKCFPKQSLSMMEAFKTFAESQPREQR
jgi:hypothetical protein